MPAQKTGIENLTKTQATLYRSYVATNKGNTNQQKEITRLCELGTEGHSEIVAIATVLKDNGERTATIKVQVSRAMANLQTGLTLQGLGKGDGKVFIGKKNTDNEPLEAPEVATKAPTPESLVEPDTKVFDFEELDRVFIAMATDQQKVMIAHLTKLMKATTKLRLAS